MDYRNKQDQVLEGLEAQTFAPLEDLPGEPSCSVEVLENGHVDVNGSRVTTQSLTKKEVLILLAVLRSKGVCTKERLFMELYNGIDEPEIKIIDVFICKLRKKLNTSGNMIETVWGRGYQASPAFRLVEPREHIVISPKLMSRIENLALATQSKPSEMIEMLLTEAVRGAEKRAWA